MKLLSVMCLALSLLPLTSLADLVVDYTDGDGTVVIDGDWNVSGDILFPTEEKIHPVNATDAEVLSNGLHIASGTELDVSNNITATRPYRNCPVIALDKGTVVNYSGTFTSKSDQAFTYMYLLDQSKFVLTNNAVFDQILENSWWTRQIWIRGDGTGIFETAEGFVADKTSGGTKHTGVGSFRLNGVTYISHSTAGLPVYETGLTGDNTPCYNGHVIFDSMREAAKSIPASVSVMCQIHSATVSTMQFLPSRGRPASSSPVPRPTSRGPKWSSRMEKWCSRRMRWGGPILLKPGRKNMVNRGKTCTSRSSPADRCGLKPISSICGRSM